MDKSAAFLTFNYTKTLETLYGIDESRITYIHNSAFTGPEAIILGHGIDPEKFEEKVPEPPDNIEPEQYEEWYNSNIDYDYSYDEGKNNIMRYFKDTFKPTKIVIDKHGDFFKQLSNVEEILVFGHSLSPVDLPYFSHIVENTPAGVNWVVSYHHGDECRQHLATLTSIGIDHKNLTLVKLDDFLESNRQLSLAL